MHCSNARIIESPKTTVNTELYAFYRLCYMPDKRAVKYIIS